MNPPLFSPSRSGRSGRHGQRGVSIIEVMVAVLLVSLGVLGVVGLQGGSVAVLSDTRYRVEAAGLADELVAQVWAQTTNAGGPLLGANTNVLPAYVDDLDELPANWLARVEALPGNEGTDQDPPLIAADAAITNQVTITLCWRAPQATRRSCHSVVTVVDRNV